MIELSKIEKEAKLEIQTELEEKAKTALVGLYRKLDTAKKIVANIEREIEDTKELITQGNL